MERRGGGLARAIQTSIVKIYSMIANFAFVRFRSLRGDTPEHPNFSTFLLLEAAHEKMIVQTAERLTERLLRCTP